MRVAADRICSVVTQSSDHTDQATTLDLLIRELSVEALADGIQDINERALAEKTALYMQYMASVILAITKHESQIDGQFSLDDVLARPQFAHLASHKSELIEQAKAWVQNLRLMGMHPNGAPIEVGG